MHTYIHIGVYTGMCICNLCKGKPVLYDQQTLSQKQKSLGRIAIPLLLGMSGSLALVFLFLSFLYSFYCAAGLG